VADAFEWGNNLRDPSKATNFLNSCKTVSGAGKDLQHGVSKYILSHFSHQNAVCFIILTYLVSVLFSFY
jgi:hypothetical protein